MNTFTNKLLASTCHWALLFCLCFTSLAQANEEGEPISWSSDKGVVVIIEMPYLELYVFPGQGFPRFHAVEKKEQLRIFKNKPGWYKVETEDGKQGWVRRSDLKRVFDQEGHLLDFSTPHWSDRTNPWQLGLLGGEYGATIAYTVYLGYRFTPNISTELKYTQAFADDYTKKLGSLMLVHQVFPSWRVSPFFTIGAGVENTHREARLIEPEDTDDTALTVGGGLMIFLHHKVMARLEYNNHTLLTTGETNPEVKEWKAGFSVLF